jgi:hypothetical protein
VADAPFWLLLGTIIVITALLLILEWYNLRPWPKRYIAAE